MGVNQRLYSLSRCGGACHLRQAAIQKRHVDAGEYLLQTPSRLQDNEDH